MRGCILVAILGQLTSCFATSHVEPGLNTVFMNTSISTSYDLNADALGGCSQSAGAFSSRLRSVWMLGRCSSVQQAYLTFHKHMSPKQIYLSVLSTVAKQAIH